MADEPSRTPMLGECPEAVDASTTDSAGAAGAADASGRRSGIASLASEDFSVIDSIGGVRGVIESVLPSLVFLVVFLATRDLALTVKVCGALCALEVLARLAQRQTIAGALSGVVMMLICLYAAYKSNDARNYYLPGCIINAVWAVVLLASQAFRAPGIGLIVEFVRRPPADGLRAWYRAWHGDAALLRAYTIATWVWIAMFVVRDAFQVPLYFSGNVGVLGTVTLVLGVPLFALVCWVSYLIIGTPLHEHRERESERDSEVKGTGHGAEESGRESEESKEPEDSEGRKDSTDSRGVEEPRDL
ncbi:DUF3159 domain-containing protein [Pseudoscardovia suis]|nr:DUF3159 domain-containing protein [Pseudoscardovia suis]